MEHRLIIYLNAIRLIDNSICSNYATLFDVPITISISFSFLIFSFNFAAKRNEAQQSCIAIIDRIAPQETAPNVTKRYSQLDAFHVVFFMTHSWPHSRRLT